MKKLRSNLAVNIISGIVVVFLLVIWIAGFIGYTSFTEELSEQYADNAYLTAYTASAIVDGSKLTEYLETGGESEEYKQSRESIESLCNHQNATFIYVICPSEDYSKITFVYSTESENSGFDTYEIGYVRDTTNNEYREIYREIYEEGLEKATIVRDTGFIESGAHITELIPIKDGDTVTGILCVQKQMEALNIARSKYLRKVGVAMALLTVLVVVLYGIYLHRRLIKPVKTITKEAERFARETSEPERTLASRITYRDEIGVLARAIDKMTAETLQYMENLTEATKARQRIATQLDVAAEIQQNSLPQTFPAFPGRDEFDIYASMTPALEVGGDFYNYFLIDDDHLAVVIADVSDKGIGAALFMMVSNILIENRALMGGKPSEILSSVNNQLCTHNEAMMFVTVWLGIMEISTGRLIAANAGHEYPIIKKGNGKFELFRDDPHGIALGLFEDAEYEDYTITLDKNGAVFVYTDGAAEAINTENKQFGTDRTIAALNDKAGDTSEGIVKNLRNEIDKFADGAPMFDDITMLCLKLIK